MSMSLCRFHVAWKGRFCPRTRFLRSEFRQLLSRFGRLAFSRLFEEAIAFAEDGFPVAGLGSVLRQRRRFLPPKVRRKHSYGMAIGFASLGLRTHYVSWAGTAPVTCMRAFGQSASWKQSGDAEAGSPLPIFVIINPRGLSPSVPHSEIVTCMAQDPPRPVASTSLRR